MSLGYGYGLGLHRKRGGGIAAAVQYVLDQYPGAKAAFALHRLNSDYDGPLIRVRRQFPTITGNTPLIADDTITNVSDTSDCQVGMRINGDNIPADSLINSFTADTITINGNTTGLGIGTTFTIGNDEQDVGFDSAGDLDTADLLTFVGAGDGFVTTVYDQSGNGFDGTQTTAGNQLRIVDAGVVEEVNGRPAMNLADSGRYITIGHGGAVPQPASRIFVHKFNDLADSNDLIDGAGGGRAIVDRTGDNYRIFATVTFDTGVAQSTDQSIALGLWNTTDSLIRVNGITSATGNVGTNDSPSAENWGQQNGVTSGWDGYLQSYIRYDSDQSANFAGIEANLAAYYGITLP